VSEGAQPFISVIVPVYNGEATIQTCVESLLELDYPRERFEVLIVDNRSTDGTRAILRRYPVRVLEETEAQSSYAARNLGIRESRGEVLAFTDADCVVEHGWLRAIARAIAPSDVGGVAGPIESYASDSPIERYQANRALRAERAYHHHVLPFAQTANAAYRRSVFDGVGLFNPAIIFGGDLDLSWRMQRELGLRLVYEPLAFVWHRHRTTVHGLFALYEKNAIANCLLAQRYDHYAEYPRLRTLAYLARECLRSALRGAVPRGARARERVWASRLDAVRYAGEIWGWLRWHVGAVTLPAVASAPRLQGIAR